MAGSAVRVLLAVAIAVAAAAPAEAAPGDLDPTFSADGLVVTNLGAASDAGQAVAVQPDGKILVAGSTSDGTTTNFSVVRYTAAGALDTTFAGDGIQTTDFGGNDTAYGMALQPDGKIVLAGYTTSGTVSDFALARYLPTGALDTSFSGDGKVTTDFGTTDQALAVGRQADGKLVVVGWTGATSTVRDIAVARYASDGLLDATFAGDGMQTVDVASTDQARAVIQQPDGKLVIAGTAGTLYARDFSVVRLAAGGSLDPTFSGDGKQTTNIGEIDLVYDLALQSDGRIVAAGYTDTTTQYDIAVVRYDPDGALDSGFAGDGVQTTDFGTPSDYGDGVVIDGSGKIVVAGASSSDFALVRYNPNGAIDTSFSGDGKQTTDFGATSDWAHDIALHQDGKIVAAGTASGDVAVARYLGDDLAPPQTTIDSGPSGLTNDRTPLFTFSSSEPGSTFQCSTDYGTWSTCTSPYTALALADGPHAFSVRATDPAGNTDPSPATRTFTVDTVAPDTTIGSGPTTSTTDTTPTFTVAASEPGARLEYRVDAGGFRAGQATLTIGPLAVGRHTFMARAIDRAGNADATPASRSFLVTTVQPAPPVEIGLSAAKKQKLGRRITVTAWSEYAGCTATATGKLRVGAKAFALVRVKRELGAGQRAKLALKLPAKARTAAAKALRAHKRVRASITVVGVDSGGRSDTAKVTVRVIRR